MLLSSKILKSSMTLTIFFILIMASLFSKKKQMNKNMRKMKESKIALSAMKMLTILAIMNLMIFILGEGNQTTTSIMPWLKDSKIKSFISMMMDKNFMFFSTAALIVTWSIVEFSIYYMHKDPFKNKFFRLLMMFLLKMLMLTSAKKVFLFFMGWEGVGFLSFLLMSWWSTRTDAKSSALQAMIYNRIGDIGVMVMMSAILINTKSWNLSSLLTPKMKETWMTIILFTALLGTMGKSAQFGLHPWLPAAMEGPTPVSALLHSSTMVVAGVFLLIRITKIMTPKEFFLKMTLMIGSLTAIFAATSAFQQHDMKKMMAYSTTSQLGLMVVALGLGKPKIALFHICTHAFFKAMLFLCSGSMMHSYKKEQDLRKMSKMKEKLPITASCLFLGSMALMGIPFLSGFYSKDLILELVMENPSNLISFSLAIMATLLTAAYSFRIIAFCFLKNTKKTSMNPMKEEKHNLFYPLTRLAFGAIFMGWIISCWLLETPNIFPMKLMKEAPMTVTMMGASMASSLIMFTIKSNISKTFFTKTWFYTKTAHSTYTKIMNSTALFFTTRTLDRGWSETMGGQGIFSMKSKMTKTQQMTQTGYIKQYLLSMSIMAFSILFLSIFT